MGGVGECSLYHPCPEKGKYTQVGQILHAQTNWWCPFKNKTFLNITSASPKE